MTSRRAFTLVEVILAILIISGITVVLLYFYQRAAETRESAMRETEFLSAARLVLEQVTTELRSARVVQDQFIGLEGSSNSLTFICTGLPQVSRWITDTNDTVSLPSATDLKRVHYGLLVGTNLSDSVGIERSERLLLMSLPVAETNTVDLSEDLPAIISNAATNEIVTTNRVAFTGPLLTDRIRFLYFRYSDGTDWFENWSGLDLPAAVEITLGREAMPMDIGESGYPYEIFRRTVHLPNSTHPGNRVDFSFEEDPLL